MGSWMFIVVATLVGHWVGGWTGALIGFIVSCGLVLLIRSGSRRGGNGSSGYYSGDTGASDWFPSFDFGSSDGDSGGSDGGGEGGCGGGGD